MKVLNALLNAAWFIVKLLFTLLFAVVEFFFSLLGVLGNILILFGIAEALGGSDE